MKKILILSILCLFIACISFGQSDDMYEFVKKDWEQINCQRVSTDKIINQYNLLSIKHKKNKKNTAYNDLFYILNLCQNAEILTVNDLSSLPSLNIEDPIICEFMKKHSRILSDYYTLKSLKSGNSYSESKSGMSFNTAFGGLLGDVDYQLMTDIFSSKNEELKNMFLKVVHFSIRYNGLTEALMKLRPVIERNVAASDSKNEILAKYREYEHLLPCAMSPDFTLKNLKGVDYKLSDYRGKIVVIDVWATWCSGCIKKLPDFLETRNQYKDRDDIVFMVISIDSKSVYNKWKFSHPKYNLMDIVSLIASKEDCDFEKDYNITGIPRYMIIDKEGKIVSAYAPAPGSEFVNMINKALQK